MGLKGCNYVKEYFSWDVVMDKIKEELAKIVQQGTDDRGRMTEDR